MPLPPRPEERDGFDEPEVEGVVAKNVGDLTRPRARSHLRDHGIFTLRDERTQALRELLLVGLCEWLHVFLLVGCGVRRGSVIEPDRCKPRSGEPKGVPFGRGKAPRDPREERSDVAEEVSEDKVL